MNGIIKTRKVTLIPCGDKEQKNFTYKYIKKISNDLTTVGNEVIRLHVCNQYEIDRIKKETPGLTKQSAIKILQETLKTSIQNSGYQMLSKYDYISSDIRTGFNSVIYKTITNNFFDIINGKVSIPSFRKTNLSIPFSFNSETIYMDNDKFTVNLPLSNSEKKVHKEIKFNLFFGKDKSGNKTIINRIVSGDYKVCNSSIKIENDDITLFLVFEMPKNTSNVVDTKKVMGIDLGINRLASIYITNQKYQPSQIELGNKVQHERTRIKKEVRLLQKSLKFSSGGHGREKKMVNLERYKNYEKNFYVTLNHKISSDIIKIAKNNNVGLIKMEDLTGITTNSKDYYLKSWAYYQLQTMVKYKSEIENITVLYVNPKDTSRTCPCCGYISKDNRNDIDKTIFKCTNPECNDFDLIKDADIVASFNIANKEGDAVKPKSKEGKKLKNMKKLEEVLDI